MANASRRPAGLRAGRPQLTAGHGGPVFQPWRDGDQAEEQRLEVMPFAGFLPVTQKSTLNSNEPIM